MRIASGVTDQYIYFVAVDSTDFTSRETGLSSFTVYRSRNGGAAAAMTTPTINETDSSNMPGVYELLLDEDMTIDSGDETQEMAFHITHAGMAPVTRTIELYRPKITAGNTLDVTATGAAGIDWNNIENPSTTVDLSSTTVASVDAVSGDVGGNVVGAINTGAGTITTLDGLDTAQDSQHSTTQTAISNLNDPSAATIADAVWDEDIVAAHGTSDTAGLVVSQLTHRALGTGWSTDITANSALDYLADDGSATYDRTTDSLQALADSGGGGPTAAQIADAVWDESTSGHTTSGTFGEQAKTDVDAILAFIGVPNTFTITGDIAAVQTAVDALADDNPNRLTKNVAVPDFQVLMVDSSDDPLTGLTVSGSLSGDGGSFSALTNSVSEMSNGMYKVDLAQEEMNYDVVTVRFTASGAKDRFITFYTQPT